jgi:hypothetical protein
MVTCRHIRIGMTGVNAVPLGPGVVSAALDTTRIKADGITAGTLHSLKQPLGDHLSFAADRRPLLEPETIALERCRLFGTALVSFLMRRTSDWASSLKV